MSSVAYVVMKANSSGDGTDVCAVFANRELADKYVEHNNLFKGTEGSYFTITYKVIQEMVLLDSIEVLVSCEFTEKGDLLWIDFTRFSDVAFYGGAVTWSNNLVGSEGRSVKLVFKMKYNPYLDASYDAFKIHAMREAGRKFEKINPNKG